MNYLSEAFKKLDFLTEEDFSLSNTDSIDNMGQLLADPGTPAQDVIDPEAETEDELQDTYIGKVILHCPVCNSMVYKKLEDIVKDDVEELVNVGEECPYCYTSEGFKVIGIVSPFEGTEDKEDEKEDSSEEEKESEENVDEGLKEEFEKVEVATEDQKVTLDADDDGKLTIEAEPVKDTEEEAEVLAPVPTEVADTIEETEESPWPEDEVDYDVEDFDSDSFDELGEAYLKAVYENVSSYKTTDVSSQGNTLVVEGLIKFNSGKMKPTKFVFEAKTATKNNKLRFIGENKNITRGRKAFTLTGTLNENKSFITERFNYNYMTKNKSGKSTRIYGTLKTNSLTEAQEVNLSEKGNSINKLLLDNKGAIDGAASKEELVKACQDILADKGGAKAQQFLQVLKAKKNHYAALKYVYDFILAGEGQRSPDSKRKTGANSK
jgi:hypothetical protein|nr:MAG TPA: hypothetical protein [Caudoviricetes sp.]